MRRRRQKTLDLVPTDLEDMDHEMLLRSSVAPHEGRDAIAHCHYALPLCAAIRGPYRDSTYKRG